MDDQGLDDFEWVRGISTLYHRSKKWGEGEILLHSENSCPIGKLIPPEFVVFGASAGVETCDWCVDRTPHQFRGLR